MKFERGKQAIRAGLWGLLVFALIVSQWMAQPAWGDEAIVQIQGVYEGPDGSLPYLLFIPAGIPRPAPLVVMLHGCTQNAADFARGTSMNRLAASYGFMVLYPEQTPDRNASRCWNWFLPEDQHRGLGEPALIAGLVETVIRQYPVDWRRVYVAGFSAGAAMAVVLGVTYPDLFAAIGVHSGLEYGAAHDLPSALLAMQLGGPDPEMQGTIVYAEMGSLARVMPVIVFHGDSDLTVREVNGQQVVRHWLRTGWLASGGRVNVRFDAPDETFSGQIPDGYAYTVRRWLNGAGDVVAEYWLIRGMTHRWSGGDPSGSYTDPAGPSASQAMWAFFQHYVLPAKVKRCSGDPC